jgi:hypothetical protein
MHKMNTGAGKTQAFCSLLSLLSILSSPVLFCLPAYLLAVISRQWPVVSQNRLLSTQTAIALSLMRAAAPAAAC